MHGIPETCRLLSQGELHHAEPDVLPSKLKQMRLQMERAWNSVSLLRLDRTDDSEKLVSTNC